LFELAWDCAKLVFQVSGLKHRLGEPDDGQPCERRRDAMKRIGAAAGPLAESAPSIHERSELVHAQLRALVQALCPTPDLADELDDRTGERVLMDIHLDGRRYLLVALPAVQRKAHLLSPRETEIVRLVAEGHPNKVIAAVLEISCWTVGTHVRRVFAKLGVTSRAAMVARLAEFGRPIEAPATAAWGDDASDNAALDRSRRAAAAPSRPGVPTSVRARPPLGGALTRGRSY
jgi:DNA-binding CsgD family transcriptional regulator